MDIGKKIKALRTKSKLTQEQLADRLGINAQSVSKWENSVTMPGIRPFKKTIGIKNRKSEKDLRFFCLKTISFSYDSERFFLF